MKNIESEEDIRLLVDSFYEKAMKDEVIGYIFTDIAKISLEHHLPILYQFWSSVLLGTSNYQGNPMGAHIQLAEKEPLTKNHFDRWLTLWVETVDQLFEGNAAMEAKQRAKNIAGLMLYKVNEITKKGN